MTFERRQDDHWEHEVPGTRWFRADLHVHTIDDHLGGRAKLPAGLEGLPDDPELLSAYARRFVQQLVESDIQVVGLTPHSPRGGVESGSSAVWRIVKEWNAGLDDDGVPFRHKVFAVFPGFEINVNDGAKGVHLTFLFDPEIGLQDYLAVFDAMMGGRAPWRAGRLTMSPLGGDEVFRLLDDQKVGLSEGLEGKRRWDWIALAPHLVGAHGLQREMSAQVRDEFPMERLAGFGLPRNKLPDDYDESSKPGRILLPLMRTYRQAFYHASDAYCLEDVGGRHTRLKLATPRIAAVTQAFVASDARVRIGYERGPEGDEGDLVESQDPRGDGAGIRPWLRRVDVEGKAAFFGRGGVGKASFSFSPDLTCIIGGSMTGKSTLLDGLRVHTEAGTPARDDLRKQVTERAENFLAGAAAVSLDCGGSLVSGAAGHSWPATFFTQTELQQLARDAGAVEKVLANLDGSVAREIEELSGTLDGMDRELDTLAEELSRLDDRCAEAEQAEARAREAQKSLRAFREAGVETALAASRVVQAWRSSARDVGSALTQAEAVAGSVAAVGLPSWDAQTLGGVWSGDRKAAEVASGLERSLRETAERFASEVATLRQLRENLRSFIDDLGEHERSLRKAAERALADSGRAGAEVREFQDLSRRAALLPNYEAVTRELNRERQAKEERFDELGTERQNALKALRTAFDSILERVAGRPGSRVRARRLEGEDTVALDAFLRGFKQRGITRWWGDSSEKMGQAVTPRVLLEHLEANTLASLGMSDAVARTFREAMTVAARRRLAALPSRDLYRLEMKMDDGSYRSLSRLSGGQRVSVMLTLLLENEDSTPLVIDQPEDELDNRFLFETVLPALKALKGRRQVIVATHDPNIVVNGDADMVIQLDATSTAGRVAAAGTIDDPAIRDAIVQTVDGGREAFRLRRRKYGF